MIHDSTYNYIHDKRIRSLVKLRICTTVIVCVDTISHNYNTYTLYYDIIT